MKRKFLKYQKVSKYYQSGLVVDSMEAEFKALKSFVMNELYATNLNIHRVRTEQSDQTKQSEDNFKNM